MKITQRARVALGMSVLVVLGTTACGSAPRTNYYTVRPGSPTAVATNPGAGVVGVAVPQADHLLRQDRIVYFTNNNELNYYDYHRWAESPVFLVRSAIVTHLRGGALFSDVVEYRAQKGLDYVLRSRLLAMEEIDQGTEVSARFGLEMELVRQEDAQVVWSSRHTCTQAVGTKTVEAVVEAIGRCAEETLSTLTRSLAAAVPQFGPARGSQKEQSQ